MIFSQALVHFQVLVFAVVRFGCFNLPLKTVCHISAVEFVLPSAAGGQGSTRVIADLMSVSPRCGMQTPVEDETCCVRIRGRRQRPVCPPLPHICPRSSDEGNVMLQA